MPHTPRTTVWNCLKMTLLTISKQNCKTTKALISRFIHKNLEVSAKMFNPSSFQSYVKEWDRWIKQSAQRKNNSENKRTNMIYFHRLINFPHTWIASLNIMVGMTKDLNWCNPSLFRLAWNLSFIKASGKQPAGTNNETNNVNNTR